MWHWNLTDEFEKQQGTSSKQHQAVCIISSSYVNLNWSYSRERLSWALTSVTLTFDLWPWPFARISPLSLVITPKNVVMIRWWEHSEKASQTASQPDRQTDWTIHRAAWSQLKIILYVLIEESWDICHNWLCLFVCLFNKDLYCSLLIMLHISNEHNSYQ